MGRPSVPKITKNIVDSTSPKKARIYIWDSSLPGFGLVVQPSGVKSFVFQYRNAEGQTKRLTIGRYGEALTPDQARKKAKQLQADVMAGRDPLSEKQARQKALTVSQLLDKYLDSAKFAQKAESTQSVDRGRVERHIRPLIGRKVADKLSADDVRRMYNDIKEGKTSATVKTKARGLAVVRGGEGAARMATRLIKAIYSWAVVEGIITENPTTSVKVSKDGRREIVLEQEDYARMFRAIDELEQTRRISSAAADAVRVIALTGSRRGEIAGLRWRHVNLKTGMATLQSDEHKAGRKTGESRKIGLPTAAQAIISRQPEGKGEDYVFQPARGEGPVSLSKPWRLIRDQAGLPADAVLHSLRHSLATSMADSGAGAAQIMAVMGHKDLATSQKYIHIAKERRAELAEKAAAGISAALTGSAPGEIVAFGAGKN
jgi:integrase